MPTQQPHSRQDAALVGSDPVTVVVGEEELLVERAVRAVLAASAAGTARVPQPASAAGPGGGSADGAGPGPDVHDVRAGDLSAGQLSMLTSPSLFGGESVVIVRAAQDANSAVAAELGQLAAAMPSDLVLVVTHAGGAKGKAVLTALSKAGARRIDCPAVRRFGERMDFLRAEFARAGRKADDGGSRALLDAVGTDLRDLAAACDQLVADTTGVITAQVVSRYWRGRAEATGFSVADRVLEGNLVEALAQLRWALAIGTAPVLITSALARGIRTLGRVGSASRGKSAVALGADLGMPSWMVDKARQQARGWTADGLARAHSAVALADAQVKGEAANAGYALERVLRVIAECRAKPR
ncbi:MAG TPA: DNA polymerase III subunit delta [Streptosporangiaceae bacterium]|nr:DNA polymerase III subunit delta [Streptosporangiaceae bacterium]